MQVVMRDRGPDETHRKPTGSRVFDGRSRVRAKHLLLAVLGIGLLLSPAAIADTQTGSQVVTAQVAHAIELEVPPAYDWGLLAIGENESGLQNVVVKSTARYDLNIRADRTKMAEYDLAVGDYIYGGRELQNALQWKEAYLGSYSIISTVDMPVVVAAPPTGSAGATTSIQFRQIVGYGDQALSEGKVYRIVITYTAMNTV
jgi:hypothetical protein